ncbi:thioredoxin [Patescibacteria group bacterium]|nr:thioredoxin [Patescibacteria group bacterium]
MLKKFVAIIALMAIFIVSGCSAPVEEVNIVDSGNDDVVVAEEGEAAEGTEVDPGADIADEQDYAAAQAELLEPTNPIVPEIVTPEVVVPEIKPIVPVEPVDVDGMAVPAASAEVILAQCMTANGAKLYTASWCGHCQNQKAAFADGLQYLDNTECAVADGWAEECKTAGVEAVPTWIFADGTKQSGNTPLAELASKTGCIYQ